MIATERCRLALKALIAKSTSKASIPGSIAPPNPIVGVYLSLDIRSRGVKCLCFLTQATLGRSAVNSRDSITAVAPLGQVGLCVGFA